MRNGAIIRTCAREDALELRDTYSPLSPSSVEIVIA